MNLKIGEKFCRDGYSLSISKIYKSDKLWHVKVNIYTNEKFLMKHGFKSQIEPNRTCLTMYMDKWLPKVLALRLT